MEPPIAGHDKRTFIVFRPFEEYAGLLPLGYGDRGYAGLPTDSRSARERANRTSSFRRACTSEPEGVHHCVRAREEPLLSQALSLRGRHGRSTPTYSTVTKVFGFWIALGGTFMAGWLIPRIGMMSSLIIGTVFCDCVGVDCPALSIAGSCFSHPMLIA